MKITNQAVSHVYFTPELFWGLLLLLIFTSIPVYANEPAQVIKSSSTSAIKSNHIEKSVQNKINDLRVIVDISGSMKKTDPNNLRRPAIRLLASLIPAGSRSGIWNFGKQVNMAVKIGPVDETWRKNAFEQSKKINSVGLFTNIESALRKVSFDWKTPDPKYKRALILLTDGHVDINEDENIDKASRQRILKDILPQLENAKVKVHTIALSDNVDESLLTTLSAYTDGLYKKVNNADDLQKLFLQMLEQAVKLDTLPLKDNRFNVDASINDMTLLVFNKDKSNPTTIVTPAKKTWKSTTKNEKLKWFSDEGYDLITIKKPRQGQWKIMAPMDENNRVVVATNLKLKVDEIPSYLMAGDKLNVTAQLLEGDKILEDNNLLSKFIFTVIDKVKDSTPRDYPLARSEEDSLKYSVQLPAMFKEGNHELIIQAKSPTAEREIRHQLKVYTTPAEIKIVEKDNKYQIIVNPYNNLLRLDTVDINVELEDKSQHKLERIESQWLIEVDKKYHETLFSLNINAKRADGKLFTTNFNKILTASNTSSKLTLENKKDAKNESDISKAKDVEPEKKETKEESENKNNESDLNWTVIIISIVVGNLFIVLLVVGGYLYFKRRKQKMVEAVSDEMIEDNDSVAEDKADAKE